MRVAAGFTNDFRYISGGGIENARIAHRVSLRTDEVREDGVMNEQIVCAQARLDVVSCGRRETCGDRREHVG